MSNSTYMLVNPYIEGDIRKIFRATSSKDAAKEAWDAVSKYVAGSVKYMYLTLQRTSNDSLHHFKIEESVKKGGNIDCTVSSYDPNVSQEVISHFKEKLDNAQKDGMKKKQKYIKEGGNKHKNKDDDDDDDSSSSSDSPVYKHESKQLLGVQPIYYWWYYPMLYNIDKIYMPPPLSPLLYPIEISLPYLPAYRVE
jgi:hypothetical protein